MKLINTKFRPLRPLKPSVYMYFFFGGFCLMREAGGGGGLEASSTRSEIATFILDS